MVVPPQSILVVSTTGMGDTLWGTPAIKALKKSFPEAVLSVMTSGVGAELLCGNPYIDHLFKVGEPALPSLLRLYPRLKQIAPDTILIFHASQRALYPFCALLRPQRLMAIAGRNKGLDELCSDLLPDHSIHEIEQRLAFVERLGGSWEDSFLECYLQKEDETRLRSLLQESDAAPILLLHPGSKDRFKQWPVEKWIELGERLSAHLGCHLLVTGDPSERELAASVAAEVPLARSIAGELSPRELAALMRRAKLLLTADTGPMHLGFAMGLATVALFCPTDPKLCGPHLATSVRLIQKRRACTPCLRKRCPDPFCMRQISVDEVYQAALSLFYRR